MEFEVGQTDVTSSLISTLKTCGNVTAASTASIRLSGLYLLAIALVIGPLHFHPSVYVQLLEQSSRDDLRKGKKEEEEKTLM